MGQDAELLAASGDTGAAPFTPKSDGVDYNFFFNSFIGFLETIIGSGYTLLSNGFKLGTGTDATPNQGLRNRTSAFAASGNPTAFSLNCDLPDLGAFADTSPVVGFIISITPTRTLNMDFYEDRIRYRDYDGVLQDVAVTLLEEADTWLQVVVDTAPAKWTATVYQKDTVLVSGIEVGRLSAHAGRVQVYVTNVSNVTDSIFTCKQLLIGDPV